MNYFLNIQSFERAVKSSESEAMRNLAEGMIALAHAIQSDFWGPRTGVERHQTGVVYAQEQNVIDSTLPITSFPAEWPMDFKPCHYPLIGFFARSTPAVDLATCCQLAEVGAAAEAGGLA